MAVAAPVGGTFPGPALARGRGSNVQRGECVGRGLTISSHAGQCGRLDICDTGTNTHTHTHTHMHTDTG